MNATCVALTAGCASRRVSVAAARGVLADRNTTATTKSSARNFFIGLILVVREAEVPHTITRCVAKEPRRRGSVNWHGRRAASRSVVGCCRTVLAQVHLIGQKADRRASRIARASQALSSSFAAVFPGNASAGTRVRVGDGVLASLARLATGGVWDLIHFALLD